MDIDEKYLLLVKITEVMIKKGFILSKISLHQLVYIIQELYCIDNFYNFKLFTYGPYAVELTSDLDYLFKNKILKVEYCQGPEYFGSKIQLKEGYQSLFNELTKDFLYNIEDKVVELIESFGNNNARSLELRGTIIYLYINEDLKSTESIIKGTKKIKPYFSENEIEIALEDLHDFIKIDNM